MSLNQSQHRKKPSDRLLTVPGGPRIALGLWLLYPEWRTVEEVLSQIRIRSRSRIEQVLKDLTESELVERRRKRNVSHPGVKPYEYRLSFPLAEELQRKGLVLVDDRTKERRNNE